MNLDEITYAKWQELDPAEMQKPRLLPKYAVGNRFVVESGSNDEMAAKFSLNIALVLFAQALA
jgi:hypothetical protein